MFLLRPRLLRLKDGISGLPGLLLLGEDGFGFGADRRGAIVEKSR